MKAPESRQSALIPAFLLYAIVSFSGGAVGSTHLYLIEQSVCRERYSIYDPQILPDGGLIDETLCKSPEIQSKVAQINGIYKFLDFLPPMILTAPWGKLTRVFGKRNVLFLNTLSFVLGQSYIIFVCYFHNIFDIRAIYLRPLFETMGGGGVIISSLLMTYVAESVESKDLSGVLYKFSALSLAATFLGLSLSSYLLCANVWLLSSIGLITYVCAVPVTLFFPPDIPYELTNYLSSENSTSDPSSETTSLLPPSPSKPNLPPSALHTIFEALKFNPRHTFDLFTDIIYSLPLSRLTVHSFFLLSFVNGIRVIFTQWASITYSWILADVNALSSFEMLVSGGILLSLPILTKRYLTPQLSSSCVDMAVSKIALAFLFLGLALMSAAPTRVCYVLALSVYTLGTPLPDSLRGFSTGLVGAKEEVERLYLGIGMMEKIGGMISTALWSGVFSNVLGRGWVLERAVFWGCLGLMVVTMFVLRRLETVELGIELQSGDNCEGRGESDI